MENFYADVAEKQTLFFIGNEDMVASVPSKEEGEVVCLWSNFKQAERALKRAIEDGDWQEYSIVELPVEEALNYLLPSMEDNDLLIGLNWPSDLKGEEISCEELILTLEKMIDEEAGRKLRGLLQESHPLYVIEDPEHPESFMHLAARSAKEGALAVWTEEEIAKKALAQGEWGDLNLKTVTASEFAALARGKYLAIDWVDGGLTPEYKL